MKLKVTNWPEYEAGLRRRGSLTLWVTEDALSLWPAPKRTTRGGQPRYSDLAIENALTLGLVFGLRLRQTEGFLASVFRLMNLALAIPDYTTLSRRASKPRSPKRWRDDRDTILDKGRVHMLIDSTGLQIYGAGQWLEEKHGTKSRRNWRKLHLALDADSGDIIAHVITNQDAGDTSQVEVLLGQVNTPIGQFTAKAPTMVNRPMMPSPGIVQVLRLSFHPCQWGGASGRRSGRSTKPTYRGDRCRWSDEMAGRYRLWETSTGRDRDRSLQIDHRLPAAGRHIPSAADGSRHRLYRPQSNAGMRTPEIRPLQKGYRIATTSKTEIR